jgi:hypothetical protein
MMADNELNDVDGDDIFVYTGGDQEVPRDIKRLRIAENVDTIPLDAFRDCQQLIEVEGHDRLRTIERSAFYYCTSLRRARKMIGLIEIEEGAFEYCWALIKLEFDKLEIIGDRAFAWCTSLRSINLPSVRRVCGSAFAYCYARSINMPSIINIEGGAFQHCDTLTDAVFGRDLERIEGYAFYECTALRRIAIPLKDNLVIYYNAFSRCENFSTVDILAGEIHTTISSLHMESWRNEMQEEIDRINQTLPNIRIEKAGAIKKWITRILSRMEHYKSEHKSLLKEAMTLLELALWKAKLLNEAGEKKCKVDEVTKKAKIDTEAARKEHRFTCGASIVIKNVLPFLH